MPRTYYGMPAWGKDGKVLCFFQPASKFKVRYGTFGFEPISNLDDGTMWPTAYAAARPHGREPQGAHRAHPPRRELSRRSRAGVRAVAWMP